MRRSTGRIGRKPMATKKLMSKYHKGDLILSLEALVTEILAGRAVYMRDKVQNPAWLQNMNLRTLELFVGGEKMWYAIENAGNYHCEACGGNGTVYQYNEDGVAIGKEACPWCGGELEIDI
jgi:hypothetical protein